MCVCVRGGVWEGVYTFLFWFKFEFPNQERLTRNIMSEGLLSELFLSEYLLVEIRSFALIMSWLSWLSLEKCKICDIKTNFNLFTDTSNINQDKTTDLND